jgi:predicted nucleotidyltransferase
VAFFVERDNLNIRNDITTIIEEELRTFEAALGVKVLLAAEVGPRAKHTNSESTKHDVRFVYAKRTDVAHEKDFGITREEIIRSDELDLWGWRIDAFLGMLCETDRYAYELLASKHIYQEDETFAAVREEAKRVFIPARYAAQSALVEMPPSAMRNAHTTDGHLERLYRVLAARYAMERQCPPPISLDELMCDMTTDESVQIAYQSLIVDARCGLGDRSMLDPKGLDEWLNANARHVLAKADLEFEPPKPIEDESLKALAEAQQSA